MKENNIVKKINTYNTIQRVDKKIKYLNNSHYNTQSFLFIRLISTIILFVLCSILINVFLSLIISFCYYISYEYLFLDLKVHNYKRLLEKDALYFFELLDFSLNKTKDLKQSLKILTNSLGNNRMACEFKNTLMQVSLGKDLKEALDEMSNNIVSPLISKIILNISQVKADDDKIHEVIKEQLGYLRENDIHNQKENVSKTSLSLSIISLVILIPILLLIIFLPVIIK